MDKEISTAGLVANYTDVIIAAAVVLFGASAHTAAQYKSAREQGKRFGIIDTIIAIIISAFAGMMFGFVAAYLFEDQNIINACSGAGALLGLQGVNALSNTLLDILAKRASND